MRKSAAPSRGIKRLKFEIPFSKADHQAKEINCFPSVLHRHSDGNTKEKSKGNSTVRSTSDILQLLQMPTEISGTTPEIEKPFSGCEQLADCISPQLLNSFENESTDKSQTKVQENLHAADATEDGCRYFNVMWCKLSSKKHKKWEGDAILIVKEKTAMLKNMEGREIGRSVGYKKSEMQAIAEGVRFVVGGKECEIQNEILKEDYLSGSCFLPNETVEALRSGTNSGIINKTFASPLRDNNILTKNYICIKQKGFVNNPHAIVMPRPNESHQWKYNVNHLPIVDVAIDPRLAVHLRPHQKEGVIFLYECIMGMRDYSGCGAILADEMGLGKTLQCIALIWTLLKQGPYGGQPIIKRALIIAPSSLTKNWLQEFYKWLGREQISVYAVDQKNTVQNFTGCKFYKVLLISYEMFVRSFESLEPIYFDIVICDEGHRLKNASIKTSNTITKLPTLRRVVLTGTPIQNDLGEFYSIVEFCNPGIIGSPALFKKIYENPIVKSQQPNSSSNDISVGLARAGELTRLTNMFVLRRTQDVINRYLPSKVESVIMCQLAPLQVAIYKYILQSKILKSCLSFFQTTDGACHLACITILRKLCNHPYLLYRKTVDCRDENDPNKQNELYSQMKAAFPEEYKHFERVQIVADSGKMHVLSNLLESLHNDKQEKIVIVSGYTQTLDLLEDLCKRCHYTFLRLDGTTPTIRRITLVNTFNSPHSKHFVFLLSSKAGGLGLNLVGASRIVLYDIDWNPATDLQAMARIWRDGQRRKVYVYRLLTAGTIEEKIYQRQVTKQSLSGAVMDSNDTGKAKFSLDDLKDLFSFKENAVSTTHDLLQCTCNGDFKASASNNSNVNSEQRACQLGESPLPQLQKNATMSTLMRWDHISGTNLSNYQTRDKYLSTRGVTFIFYNKVKNSEEQACL